MRRNIKYPLMLTEGVVTFIERALGGCSGPETADNRIKIALRTLRGLFLAKSSFNDTPISVITSASLGNSELHISDSRADKRAAAKTLRWGSKRTKRVLRWASG